MAFYPAPIPLIDLIRRYDHLATDNLKMGFTNLLVEQISYVDDQQSNLLQAVTSLEKWYDSTYVSMYAEKKPSPLPQVEVQISATFEEVNRLFSAQKAYLHHVEVVATDPLKVCITGNSLITVLNDDFRTTLHPQTWYIEQFSGAFGGWSFAKQFLLHHGIANVHGMRTIAVERDLPSAVQFALNHQHSILGDCKHLPTNFIFEHPQDYVCVCGVEEFEWRNQIEWLPIDLWSISAPCQPWSKASHQQGMYTQNGMALAESICHIRVHRPKAVMIENVAGIREHPQFTLIQRLLTWAGYAELGSNVIELADITPVKRSRFLALYIRQDLFDVFEFKDSKMQLMGWPSPNQSMPKSFDAIFPLTVAENSKFALCSNDLQRYFEKDLMPGRLRVWNHREVLDYRIPSLDQKLQTFMCAYGEQHLLPPYSLQTSGLFGQFQRQGAIVRFWTPIEIAMLHVQPQSIILLKPAKLSWQALGNSIAPLHAVFLFVQALQILQYIDPEISVTEVIQTMLDHRLRVGSTAMKQDQFAWYRGTPNDNDSKQQMVHRLVASMSWTDDATRTWPNYGYYDFLKGFVTFPRNECDPATERIPISPTQCFHLLFQMQLVLVPGEYGIYQVSGNTTWRSLLSLWDFRMKPDIATWDQNLLDHQIKNTLIAERFQLIPIDESIPDEAIVSKASKPTPSIPMIFQESTDLTIYEIEHATTWQDVKNTIPLPEGQIMDSFGVLSQKRVFHKPEIVTSQHIEVEAFEQFPEVYAGMLGVTFETWIPPQNGQSRHAL